MKIFLRRLRRNFIYSGINIAGLAIGIAASVLIFLWVHHERSFDRHHPEAERIYAVTTTFFHEGREPNVTGQSSLRFIQACKSEIPEIESTAVMYAGSPESIIVNNTVFSVKGYVAQVDRAWLEMFHSQLLYGSFEAFGNHPFSVALTESEVKKYFGNSQATGQTIRIDNTDYMVQAVVKDSPSNSIFRYHIMVSTDAISSEWLQRIRERWVPVSWISFVKLHPDADISKVVQKMNDIYTKNNQTNVEAGLRLLTDIYLDTDVTLFIGGDAKKVSIFALLGILLLCTACVNYINLTTARVTRRTKEVGVKKIVGAKRRTLFIQFVSETLIISLSATVVALSLIQLLTPQYQSLVNIPVSFSSPVIWVITGIVLFVVTILNGVYPALILSSFQPLHILKGMSLPKIKDSNLRKVLVVFQFTLSAALIICLITIYMQMQYIQNTDPGYCKDQIVQLKMPKHLLNDIDKTRQTQQTIKGELLSLFDIVNVSWSENYIENIRSDMGGSVDWNGRAENFHPTYCHMGVDEDFLNVFELQLTEGRWFNEGTADMQNVILNETAIREFNIREPYIGERFDFWLLKGNIIGVMKDFHFKSLHEKITPLIFHNQSQTLLNSFLAIKIQAGKSAEAIQKVEAVWKQFFPNDPFEYAFLDESFNRLYQSDSRTSQWILIFSILAVVIAVLGLFGLSVFAIERRTKELGIRKVLGASVPGIVHMLTRDFFVLVAVAFAVAAPLSWWVMNMWLENFAYRIDITVWIFVAGATVTLVIALAAVGTQAIRAAKANPVKAISSSE
ncbi:MAG: ABC transporter permease [Tannerella sp.]|nr:ABC transporter permease [Tannerella sp.]